MHVERNVNADACRVKMNSHGFCIRCTGKELRSFLDRLAQACPGGKMRDIVNGQINLQALLLA